MPQLGILFDNLSTSNYFLQIAFIFGVQNLQSIDFSKIYWLKVHKNSWVLYILAQCVIYGIDFFPLFLRYIVLVVDIYTILIVVV